MFSKQALCRQRQDVNSLSLKKIGKKKKKLSKNYVVRRMKKIVDSQSAKKKLGNTQKFVQMMF